MPPGIKWAVEYPAALATGDGHPKIDFNERTTSPPFDSRGAAQEHARALVTAYRDVELFAMNNHSSLVESRPFFTGGVPGQLEVLVKTVIA